MVQGLYRYSICNRWNFNNNIKEPKSIFPAAFFRDSGLHSTSFSNLGDVDTLSLEFLKTDILAWSFMFSCTCTLHDCVHSQDILGKFQATLKIKAKRLNLLNIQLSTTIITLFLNEQSHKLNKIYFEDSKIEPSLPRLSGGHFDHQNTYRKLPMSWKTFRKPPMTCTVYSYTLVDFSTNLFLQCSTCVLSCWSPIHWKSYFCLGELDKTSDDLLHGQISRFRTYILEFQVQY